MTLPAHPFWDYSLALYRRCDVEQACLRLQDEHSANVNLVLFCCWTGCLARAVSVAEMRAATASIAAWDSEVITVLRHLRRRLKTGIDKIPLSQSDALRNKIKSIEIEAEYIAQLRLADSIVLKNAAKASDSVRAATAIVNLKTYLSVRERKPTTEIFDQFVVILQACFPNLARPELAKIVEQHSR